jgi:hypothetical protein
MTLGVSPADLDKFCQLLDRAVDQTTRASDYLDKHGYINDDNLGGQLYGLLEPGHQGAMTSLALMFSDIKTVLTNSRAGVAEAATYYRQTDQRTADAFDAALPATAAAAHTDFDTAVDQMVCMAPDFVDELDPSTALVVPEVPDELGNPIKLLDYLSPSHDLDWLIHKIFHFDPFEEVDHWVAGDWRRFYECGVALSHLSEFCHALALNLAQGARALGRHWTGNAGQAAVNYFDHLAEEIDGMTTPLDALSKAHIRAAEAVWQMALTLEGIMQLILDDLIILGISAAATAAMSWTGIADLVGGAVMVAEVAELFELWQNATRVMNICIAVIHGIQAELFGAASEVNTVRGGFFETTTYKRLGAS